MPTEAIRQAWALALLEAHREICAANPALDNLRPPNLHLDPQLARRLGQWDEQHRLITLAERLFHTCDWDLVLRVLKHEMAHQVVSEVFRIRQAEGHGEAFTRACALLGIEAGATLDVEAAVAVDEGLSNVSRRIRKLLALGNSGDHHEAEQALLKAHELALRHNLSLSLTPDLPAAYGIRIVGGPWRRVPSYIWILATLCSEYYFVHYICRTCTEADGRRLRFIEFYGTSENLDTAEYVFGFLLAQGEREWEAYQRRRGCGRRLRLSFLKGVYRGFGEQLEQQRQTLEQTHALVWLGDPRLDALYRRRNPHVRSRSARSRVFLEAHDAGREVGQNLRLNPGLASRHSERPRQLGG